ncbi:uracil-DNA glycosylase family protein [Jatrophihabitans fulvus]
MVRHPGAESFVPDTTQLETLADAAAGCRGCDLYGPATQTVFGEGEPTARLLLVGEQPGDQEDRAGRPFVGPAGQLLARALDEAGLADVPRWTTNAVKHFRYTERGKRRIHEKPTAAQSTACRPWLQAELRALRPDVVVALGATAAGSLFGPGFTLTPNRGVPLPWPPAKGQFAGSDLDVTAFATIHPSAVLRAADEDRAAFMNGLVSDLRTVAAAL